MPRAIATIWLVGYLLFFFFEFVDILGSSGWLVTRFVSGSFWVAGFSGFLGFLDHLGETVCVCLYFCP